MIVGELEDFVREEYRRREQVVSSHFATEAPRLARACHAMAERFARGGRILAFGMGAAATDASHISVEFVHPVIVGKRALPAVARRVSSNPEAYGYLAESIRAWPDQAGLAARIGENGWRKVAWRNLTGGVVALHRGFRI